MLRRPRSCCWLVVLLTLSFLIAEAERSVAAKSPVLVPNTQWRAIGKFKFNLKGLGKVSSEALVSMRFESTDFETEAEPVGMDYDVEVEGIYSQDGKGKISLAVDEAELREELADLLVDVFEENGIIANVGAVVVQKSKVKAKAKTQKSVEVLKVKVSVKFTFTVVTLGGTENSKGKIDFSGTLNKV